MLRLDDKIVHVLSQEDFELILNLHQAIGKTIEGDLFEIIHLKNFKMLNS